MFTSIRYKSIPDVQRIAVLRANAIGDFVVTLPALEAIRSAYPVAEIVLLGQQWHASFLLGRPGPVDRVVVVPHCRGVGLPDDQEVDVDPTVRHRFFQAMTEEHFDIAIQLHGGGRYSNPFVRSLGARLTAGLKTPDAPPLDRWVPYFYFQSEVVRYLEVVSLVGAQPVTLEPHLEVTLADHAESRSVVPQVERPLVAIHPGAGDIMRRWPPEKFAAVGDALAAEGAELVVIGGREDERPLVEAVLEKMQAPAINAWGRLSLGGLLGLLSRCALLVSNDSGPRHLAEAIGTPTVSIYWCGNLFTSGPVTRTHHRPAVSWRLDCPVCGADTISSPCSHRASYVADVPTDEVAAHALDLLQMWNREGQVAGTGTGYMPSSYAALND